MKKYLIIIASIVVASVAFLTWFLSFGNNSLELTRFNLKFADLPAEFDGYRIVQLSDLHSKEFGPNQADLIELLRKARPDVIVVTGDLVNDEYDAQPGISLLTRAKGIAPVYFVTGNYEWHYGAFSELEDRLTKAGVIVLRDRHVKIKRGNAEIAIAGIDDVARDRGHRDLHIALRNSLDDALKGLNREGFTVLLTHRPELLPVYASYRMDLVFSGHTHGGQIRLPLIGALYAPDQGLLPEYVAGAYHQDDVTMLVSRGLGASVLPLRLFNRPEVVVVSLSFGDE